MTRSLPGQAHARLIAIDAADVAPECIATSSGLARCVPGLAAANSTVGVVKESHPFRSASLTEKCNKSSALVFDELCDWTTGESTYTVDSPVDGSLLLP